ncbi:FCD domain-containing protein [Cognatishimia sp. WU-CL00825]|uniref:FadR/GntR family transcriptional regulator n=1 Tax=Cognatishimia sp. WU-CL00825 TaxID=3127658 RepID=UPI00310A72EF
MNSHDTLFQPINQSSVVQAVTEQIETLILNGILKDGARLPSERDLAERMNVSRPKVREAIKQLESDGLILVRHGEGNFIAPLLGTAMSDALIQLYARHTSAFHDYLEFRLEQERFAARLAAERATVHDRTILTEVMKLLDKAHADQDSAASERADIQFHSAIVDAGHNSLLVHTMSSIYALSKQNIFYNRAMLRSIDGTGEILLQQHHDICDAIINRDPDGAADAAVAHIEFVRKSYETEQTRVAREATALGRIAVFPERVLD